MEADKNLPLLKPRPWLRWLDTILGYWLSAKPMDLPLRKRILVIRTDHIGDFVMTLPAIRYLKNEAGFEQIDVLVGSWVGDLAKEFSEISNVWICDTPWWLRTRGHTWIRYWRAWGNIWQTRQLIRRAHYDYILEFRGDLRQIVFFQVGSGAYSVACSRTGGRLLVHRAFQTSSHSAQLMSQEHLELVREVFPGEGKMCGAVCGKTFRNKPLRVGMYISARVLLKEWKWERFVELGISVVRRWPECRITVLAGNDRTDAYHKTLAALSEQNISVDGLLDKPWREVVRALKECTVVVGPDSGLGHLAAAYGIPTVTLFGPAEPERFLPIGSSARWVYVRQPCSPCLQVRCDTRGLSGAPACMDQISVPMVMAEIEFVIENRSATLGEAPET